MQTIMLTNGMVALVDDADYEYLSRWEWSARYEEHCHSFYACRSERVGQEWRLILMHRQILGLVHGDKRQGDHVQPGQTLDNQRKNLRVCAQIQNTYNRRKRSDNTSGFKGVHFNKASGKWYSCVRANKKRYFLGAFDTPEEAHAAYCAAAAEHHGEFARVA